LDDIVECGVVKLIEVKGIRCHICKWQDSLGTFANTANDPARLSWSFGHGMLSDCLGLNLGKPQTHQSLITF
jgi:hypothetical protein